MPELRIAQSLGSGENIDGFPGVPVPTTYQTPDFYSAIQDYLDTYGYSSNAGAGAGSGGIADLSNEAPHSELMEDVSESGTSDKAARSDHVHGMPGFGGVVPQIAFGQRFSSGFSPSVARADHTHGTPPLDTTNIVSINTAQTITGAKTFSALLTASGGLLASTATIGNTSITGTLGVTGATTLGALSLTTLTTKDVLTGGAGAGLGNLAAQTVDAYNIKDGAIIATKLSLPAIASVVASGAGNNTANSFFRFAYTNSTYIDPVTGGQLSGINPLNGSSVVTDPQAYQNYAVYIPASTAAGTVGQGFTNGLTLPNGTYNVTVFLRVGANTSSSVAATFAAFIGSGTGTATITGSPSVNTNQLSTTGYMGYSFAVTLAGGVTDLRIRTIAQGFDVYVSHITGIPVAATFAPYLASVFSPNVFATAATISSVSATSLVAGTIASDDIYLGTGGHIYAGTKGGTRVELNAGGLYAYSDASTITLQALNTGSITITGTINATGGSFSGNITATGTISGGTISGAQFTNGSNFSVSPTGTLTAINGTVGGWTLGATTLTGTSNLVTLDRTGFIKVQNAAGSVYAALDGRNLQNLVDVVQGATHVFKVDSSGNVSITGNVNATGGNFSGNITSTATISGGTISGSTFTNGSTFSVTSAGVLTAASGTIGGWSIGSTYLAAGSTALYSNGNVTIQNLTAAGGSFSGSISSTATITGGSINGATFYGGYYATNYPGNARITLGSGTLSVDWVNSGNGTFGQIAANASQNGLNYYGTAYFTNGTVTADGTIYANNGMYAGSWGVYDNNNRVYSPVNTPPYPVTSVNGGTGAVSISASSLGVGSGNSVTFQNITGQDITANGYFYRSGNYVYPNTATSIGIGPGDRYLSVSNVGAFATKTFVIQHPSKPDNYLVHAAIEGPTSDVFYRGEGQLQPDGGVMTDGTVRVARAVITLPDYFEALTETTGRTVMITPKVGFCSDADCTNFLTTAMGASAVVDGKFTVYSLAGYEHNCAEFFWEVKAVRKDTPQFEVEPDKARYALHGDGPYTYLTATGR